MSKAPVEAPTRTRQQQLGLLVHPGLAGSTATPLDYTTTAQRYGTKVAGLQVIPPAWVPPYVALPAWMFEDWGTNPESSLPRIRRNQEGLDLAFRLVSENGRYAIMARSSAVGEELEDRGRYKSLRVDAGVGFGDLIAAIELIYSDFAAQGRHEALGICLQRYVPREIAGHISNEVRLSATRNQWKYVTEMPASGPERGLNSKFANEPEEQSPLALASPRSVSKKLRQVCSWVNGHVDRRSHLEWCAASGRLWILQLDLETPTSAGLDPRVMPGPRVASGPEASPAAGDVFKPYRTEDDSPWHKLNNVRDFWTGVEPPRHRLFFATGDALATALASSGGRTALAAEIDRLTGGRAVLRTDCSYADIEPSNLRRTHTVEGANAVAWVGETLAELKTKGAAETEIAIILHRYIPARAAAWTFYSPGDDIVQVDCLWGLPDGLQFLSHDSFEVDARTGEELAAEVRYKGDFLQEQDDGTWRDVRVARQYGRKRALSRDALRWLALETVAIANKIEERAQIMWFCDLPKELELGQHLPWYRSKQFLDFSPVDRPLLPTQLVRNAADLEALEESEERCIVKVAPEAELVRDDEHFLDRVIAFAGGRNVPVELSGSVLGHAYYRLRAAGILVLVPHRKYPRVRGRRRHYKVVRDEIPQSIAAKGERVSVARLDPAEAVVALISKLFEEGLELNGANEPGQRVEELADVFEVVRGLAVTSKIEWDDLMTAVEEKRAKRGGFEQQTVLLETTRPMPKRVNDSESRDSGDQPVIQLSDLGVVTVEGARASISFSKLLSHESIVVELDVEGRGVKIAVTLDAGGVRLLASGDRLFKQNLDSQLKLFDENGRHGTTQT